jgi:hypothetical protein
MKLHAKLRKLKMRCPSYVSKSIKSMLRVQPLAMRKALFSLEESSPDSKVTFLANALPLPPGKTPIGTCLACYQSGRVNKPLIASCGNPSPESRMIP